METPFVIGKANIRKEIKGVTIIAKGLMVGIALDAAVALSKTGVQAGMIENQPVKPLNEEAIIKAAQEAGRIVVIEEHLMAARLGSAIATVVVRKNPVPIEFVNIGDTYAESGDPTECLRQFGLTADAIVAAVKKVRSC